MSNQVFNVMAASYFDQLCKGMPSFQVGMNFDPSLLQGSLNNPLQAYRLMCINHNTDMSFDSNELAEVVGVPDSWLDSERLVAPIDEVLRALGVMSLIFLSCLRSDGLKNGFNVDVVENALEAKNTLIEVLEINKRLMAQ